MLTEPLVRSQTWFLDPGQRAGLFPCEYVPEVPAPPGTVPASPAWRQPQSAGIPRLVRASRRGRARRRGNALSRVPAEARKNLQAEGPVRAILQLRRVWRLPLRHGPMTETRMKRPSRHCSRSPVSLSASLQPPARSGTADMRRPAVGVLHVQRGVHMLVVNGINIAVQIGDDGVLLVDAGDVRRRAAESSRLFERCPTSRFTRSSTRTSIPITPAATNRSSSSAAPAHAQAVRVIAHQSVQDRMIASAPAGGVGGGFRLNAAITLPINNTYDTPSKDFYLNGESVVIHHAPAAHTDGDSLVHFRTLRCHRRRRRVHSRPLSGDRSLQPAGPFRG